MIAREIRCNRNWADGCGDSRGHASLPSAQPVHTDPRIAGLLGVCGASWKRGGKEAVTGIQCNSIVCKATCPAALRQKERNRIAFATAERMMDLSGWRMSAKNSEHTDPIEELGEGELVNQSATHSLLHAWPAMRMSGGLLSPLPQESSIGDSPDSYGEDGLPFSTPSSLVPSGQHKVVL